VQLRSGLVLNSTEGESPTVQPGGSCAAYRSEQVFLTAAHCLRSGETPYVWIPGNDPKPVRRFAKHDTADLAVLHVPEARIHGGTYTGIAQAIVEGGDYIGFGYPVEGAPNDKPVGRVLRGYFQRQMPYTSIDGSNYFALEMSAPAPGGSSGTILAYAQDPERAAAIVAVNHDSWMTVERIEEIEENGRVDRVEVRRVISYGIAVALHGYETWINEVVEEMTS